MLYLSRSVGRVIYQKLLFDRIIHVNGPLVRLCRDGLRSQNVHSGKTVEGFWIDEIGNVPELNLEIVRLTHGLTKAKYLHVTRNDTNNAFSVGFRTTPTDSTGLPHILEHTVLCGSENYPCRDPFFHMLNRSTASFMNAMTGLDYTIYPFATQNRQDFSNLMDVYLDAVFRPRLTPTDFYQEGWRLEYSDKAGDNCDVIFKGVVYNEMKGAFCDSQYMFSQELVNSILPGHTYQYVSGGHPLAIPYLTHSDLKVFHTRYYHPTNSRLYSYGDFPMEEHLKLINERFFGPLNDRLGRWTFNTSVPPQKRWTSRQRKHILCQIDPMAVCPDRQSVVGISYLCSDITDIQENFELRVLEELLLKGSDSPFYKSLVESGLSTGFAPQTGFDASIRDTMFTVTVQGVKSQDIDKIIAVFDSTVDNIINNGFTKTQIEAVLHNVELGIKHQDSDFGLKLLFSITPFWNHDGKVIDFLKINKQMSALKSKLSSNPTYFQSKVKQYLQTNGHGLILSMTPSSNFARTLADKERKVLTEKLASMSTNQKQEILKIGKQLLSEQETEPNVSCLPTLTLNDIPKQIHMTYLQNLKFGGVPVQICSQKTNNMTYLWMFSNTNKLRNELKPYVPIFAYVFSKLATKNYDFRTLDQAIRLCTGGISTTGHFSGDINALHKHEEGLFFNSYCLDCKMGEMMNMWKELFCNSLFDDVKRLRTLLFELSNDMVNSVSSNGHHYAVTCASDTLTKCASMKEQSFGLSFIFFLKELCKSEDLTHLCEKLKEIGEFVLSKRNLRCAINLSKESETRILSLLDNFLETLPGKSEDPKSFLFTEASDVATRSRYIVLPFTVNYVAKSILTVPYEHQHYAPLRVLSNYLSARYLHKLVREKGGAYGSGLKIDQSGILSFYSYRDPNSLETLDIFDRSYDWFLQNLPKKNHIDEAKIKVFQSVDAPIPPSNKGLNNFLFGISDLVLQKHRMAVLNVSTDQLLEVAETYIKGQAPKLSACCIIGQENSNLHGREEHNWIVTFPELL